ncbi:hypothetical protein EVAR_76457_1 [Eumeta japonica]|uniref:Uncharacterized protein n=1 Tax=Eumeta variegata TaxID=151549 RepID=A0A4C1TB51_EUMVA|nr:hypothetical protein EVAR_76457_1 [Eumeta japonica]
MLRRNGNLVASPVTGALRLSTPTDNGLRYSVSEHGWQPYAVAPAFRNGEIVLRNRNPIGRRIRAGGRRFTFDFSKGWRALAANSLRLNG